MSDFDLSQLVAAAVRMQAIWQGEEIAFCFIGGLAVQRWGEGRMTQDIDASVATGFGNENAMIEKLLRQLTPRISNAADFARLHRVVVGQESGGVSVDVSLAGLPYEMDVIERATFEEMGTGKQVKICAPSDLVILKAFANRSHDWDDIRGLLIRSGQLLDWELIESELSALCELKEEPEIVDRLQRLRRKIRVS